MSRSATLPLVVMALAAGAATPAPGATITVTAVELRSAKGTVMACLTSDAQDFPKCKQVEKVRGAKAPASLDAVRVAFTDVPPGRYAIALLHDENANGKADLALGMMPKEGFGFSRDARLRMGPPSFADAAFDLGSEDRAMTIRMRYMF